MNMLNTLDKVEPITPFLTYEDFLFEMKIGSSKFFWSDELGDYKNCNNSLNLTLNYYYDNTTIFYYKVVKNKWQILTIKSNEYFNEAYFKSLKFYKFNKTYWISQLPDIDATYVAKYHNAIDKLQIFL